MSEKQYVVYSIVVRETDETLYVGSTKNFPKRCRNHKSNCYNTERKQHNIPLYQKLRDLCPMKDNFDESFVFMFLAETENITKEEAEKLEYEYIQKYGYENLLNVSRPSTRGICEHGRQRRQCRDCEGRAFCHHGRLRAQCRACDGVSLCHHERRRVECKICKGSGICKHNRVKARCKECDGNGLCEHNRHKRACKECSPVVCDICQKNYSKSTINRHVKNLHPII
jgi:hypothetical protein